MADFLNIQSKEKKEITQCKWEKDLIDSIF